MNFDTIKSIQYRLSLCVLRMTYRQHYETPFHVVILSEHHHHHHHHTIYTIDIYIHIHNYTYTQILKHTLNK
jgi:hypothetical protein